MPSRIQLVWWLLCCHKIGRALWPVSWAVDSDVSSHEFAWALDPNSSHASFLIVRRLSVLFGYKKYCKACFRLFLFIIHWLLLVWAFCWNIVFCAARICKPELSFFRLPNNFQRCLQLSSCSLDLWPLLSPAILLALPPWVELLCRCRKTIIFWLWLWCALFYRNTLSPTVSSNSGVIPKDRISV